MTTYCMSEQTMTYALLSRYWPFAVVVVLLTAYHFALRWWFK